VHTLGLADKVKSHDVGELVAEHFFKKRTGSTQVGRESDPTLTDVSAAYSLP
jgi:hypothetical protein